MTVHVDCVEKCNEAAMLTAAEEVESIPEDGQSQMTWREVLTFKQSQAVRPVKSHRTMIVLD